METCCRGSKEHASEVQDRTIRNPALLWDPSLFARSNRQAKRTNRSDHERHYRSAVAFAFLQVADSTYASDVPWAIARSSDLLEQAIRSIERVHPWGGLSLTPQMRVRVHPIQ